MLAERLKNTVDLSAYTFGKIPPQARDLEEVVLGAIMLESEVMMKVLTILQPEHFYVTAHQLIYSAMVRLLAKNEPIDILTVIEDLKKNNSIDDVGGSFYITSLTSRIASAGNVESHARIIKEKWIMREVIRVSSQSIREAYEESTDPLECLGNVMTSFSEVMHEISARESKSFASVVDETFKNIMTASEKPAEEKFIPGYSTGIYELDRLSLGFNEPDFILIGGRPTHGKSTLAFMSALANARKNVPVGFFSLEMSRNQIVQKMTAIETNIPLVRLRTGQLKKDEWESFHAAHGVIRELPIYANDKGGIRFSELSAVAKGWKAKHGIKMLFLDYLQLAVADNEKLTREQQVSDISRNLKALAKNINIPIIAVAALSRALENRSGWDKRPRQSDLREGGSLEYDPDMILFVFRAENAGLTTDEQGRNIPHGYTEIIIDKNRLGGRGIVKQVQNDETGVFENFNSYQPQPKNFYEKDDVIF